MKGSIKYIVLVFFFYSSSCSILDEPEKTTIVNIDKEFVLNLEQKLVQGRNPLIFRIETVQSVNCKNAQIVTSFNQENSKVIYNVTDITSPSPCLVSEGIITNRSTIQLENNLYVLDMNILSTIHNSGSLNVSDESFELYLEKDDGITLGGLELMKIPDNVFWGVASMNQNNETFGIDDILSRLTNSYEKHQMTPGNYGFFKITSQGDVIVHSEIKPLISRSFIFPYNGNNVELSQFFNTLRAEFPQVKIKGKTGIGFEF